MSAVLSDAEVQQALQKLPGWKKNGNAIERNFQFANFVQAMDFVNQIAEAAEAVNHHPDIHISYNQVTLALVSHDSGGVTQRDIRMAGKINELAPLRRPLRKSHQNCGGRGCSRQVDYARGSLIVRVRCAAPTIPQCDSMRLGCDPVRSARSHSIPASAPAPRRNSRDMARKLFLPRSLSKNAPILPSPNTVSGTYHLRIGRSLSDPPWKYN